MSANGWLPIEGAPKDGSPIDLWVCSKHFDYRIADCRWYQGGIIANGWQAGTGEMVRGLSITHYRIEKGPHA